MAVTGKKENLRYLRRRRIRAKVSGTTDRPRISIFKSNTAVYAQLIDDDRSVTIASVSSEGVKGKNPTERSREAGKSLAKEAGKLNISKAVFDRGGYIYAGRIKALAEGAREGGLEF